MTNATTAIGIDMGVARFATLSDGSHIDPLNSYKRHRVALRRAQQALSRKVRQSTSEPPSRNVRAKRGLNRSILDQGWSEFRRQLDCKLDWHGGWLVVVPCRVARCL